MLSTKYNNDIGHAIKEFSYGFAPDANLSLAKMSPVALITASSVNGVVTFSVSGGTPTSGSALFTWYGENLSIAFNETAASLNTKLRDILGAGNFTVSGGAWPGTGLVVTLVGNLAGLSAQTPALVSSTLSAGTAAGAVTATAVPSGKIVPWNPSKLANPAAAAVSYSGAGTGTWVAGAYLVQHTWETAAGETLASPAKTVVLTANQNLRVAAITSGNTPDEAVALNVYVNGARVARIAVATPGTGGNVVQTDIADANGATGADGKRLPDASRAYLFNDGRQNITGFTKIAFGSNANGLVDHRTTQLAGKAGSQSVQVIVGGLLNQSDIVFSSGSLAEFLFQVAPRVFGSTSAGTAEFAFGPYGEHAK